MATTPEQRDQHPLCGAKKKDGNLCRKYAGEGTKHFGTGRCRFHLGNAPMHEKRAITLEAKRQMVTMGQPVEKITAIDALLHALYGAVGHVAWLQAQIADSTPEWLGTLEGQAIVNLYNSERDRQVRIAEACIRGNVDETAIRVAEAQLTLMGNALSKAADTAGLSAPMRKRLGAALREELGAVQG